MSEQEQVRTLKDLGRYTVYSTIVLQPRLLGRPDRCANENAGSMYGNDARRVQAFGYSVGQRVPGTNWAATRAETNMIVAAQFVDEEIKARGLCWRVSARTPGEFRIDGIAVPYAVIREDMQELIGAARVAFYVGGEKPFYDAPLALRAVEYTADDVQKPEVDGVAAVEDAVGSWGQRLTVIDPPLPFARLQKFYWEIQFPDRLPHLLGPVTMVCGIDSTRMRGVC